MLPKVTRHVPPMALSDAELSEVEGFAARSGLDEIGRLCAELRTIRQLYVQQCGKISRLENMVAMLDSNPQSRYGKELNKLTGEGNAP